MKITCESCQSNYRVADEKVEGKTVKIRCRKCGAMITVSSAGVTTSPAADAVISAASPASPPVEFHVSLPDGDSRPMGLADLVAEVRSGSISPDALVWTEGMTGWQPMQEVAAVAQSLADVVDAPPSSAADVPGPVQAAPAPPVAPSEDAEPAEARRAAVVRREGGRGSRDLFGARPEEATSEIETSAPAMGAIPIPADLPKAPTGPTGQRAENSVLFSLNALTKTPRQAPETSQTTEDSGLIDLKALASKATSEPKSDVIEHAPLFAAAPSFGALAEPAVAVPIPGADAKSNTLLFALIGALGVALVGVLVVLVVVLKTPVQTQVIMMPNSAPIATPSEPPKPSEVTSASPAPTGVSSPVAAATSAPPRPKGPPGAPGVIPPKPPGSAPTAAPTPTPTPTSRPSDPCNCKGDLSCMMACAAPKK
jgi:predicted Zn finger-like uncharacterized protein